MKVVVSDDMLRRSRFCLKQAFPGIQSAHISEAIAASLGFQSGIALRTWWDTAGVARHAPLEMNVSTLVARLGKLGELGRLRLVYETQQDSSSQVCVPASAFDAEDPEIVAAAMLRSIVGTELWSPDKVNYWMSRMLRMASLATKIQSHLSANRMGDFSPKAVADLLSIASLDAAYDDGRLPTSIRQEATSFLATIPEYVAGARAVQTQRAHDEFGYAAMKLWGTLSGALYGVLDFLDGEAHIEDTGEERTVILKMLSPKYWCGDLPKAIRDIQNRSTTLENPEYVRTVGLERLDDVDTRASFPLVLMKETKSEMESRRVQE